jgi:LCP family protein required for cell wall assembly
MSVAEPPRGPLSHRDATYYRVPKPRHPIIATLVWLLVGVGGIAAAAALFVEKNLEYALSGDQNSSPEVLRAAKELAPDLPDKPVDILIIGSDKRKDPNIASGLSDTLILARLDFKQNFISLLSFPRDLYVDIPGHGRRKLNAAYGLGGNSLAIQTVTQLTGEPIERFFNVDFEAFRQLVNDSGGVYLDIDRYYFNDNSRGGLAYEQINIKPGYQKLKGADALDYVRYRHDNGADFARQARQQAFLAELKRTSRNPRGLNNIVDAIRKHVETDLRSPKRLREFLLFGLSIDADKIFRSQLQYSGQANIDGVGAVVVTTPDLINKSVDDWKNPEFGEGSGDAPTKAAKPEDVIVNVSNGSKKLLVGTRVSEGLAARGYRSFLLPDPADGLYQKTAIFYAPGKRAEAKALQTYFGNNSSVAERRAGQPTDGDLLVVVGADFDGFRNPKKAQSKPAKVKPDVITTLQLKRTIQNFRGLTSLNALVPTHLPRGAEVVYIRAYNVERGDRGRPDTLTIVLRVGSGRFGNRYVTITQTAAKGLPIVNTNTGVDPKGGGRTFYNGKNMQRLLWQKGGMTYWITNSLDDSLSAETIRDMRQFMVRPGRATLRSGEKETRIGVQEKGRTP